ncbi:hypothetical protein C2E23DRAFT_563914 [Lenzites betulinus]|nr:hypothetical protein C2E23DRAFT_563914 [Lenzites betulinus]
MPIPSLPTIEEDLPPPSLPSALQGAQHALRTAARPRDRTRAGQAEEAIVRSINDAGQNDSLSTLLDGVDTLIHSLPPLLQALDAVAQIHPFLSIAVGAFRVVVELEVKRRDNDKKIILLFLEMRNMMSSLLQLQGVRKDHVARDGLTITARLREVSEKTAVDIKECANACDTYSRKRLLVKVLKASGWDETLQEYIKRFSDRKGEFTFAISIHTGLGIDRVNDTLDVLLTKMDLVLDFFQKTMPREQQTLAEAIRQGGGNQVVLANPGVLRRLLEQEQELEAAALPPNEITGTWTAPVIPNNVPQTYQGTSNRPSGYQYYPRAAERQRRRLRTSNQAQEGYYQSQPAQNYQVPAQNYQIPPPYYQAPTQNYQAPTQTYQAAQNYGTQAGPIPVPVPVPIGSNVQRPGVRPTYGADNYDVNNSTGAASVGDEYANPTSTAELAQLMVDLADEPAVAVRKNLESFERKFQIQHQETVAKLTEVIVHEGDRVIGAVLDGPHEKIIDPVLYEIWKDMRWRGIVKARHLVLAIQDYYTQRLDDHQRAAVVRGAPPQHVINESDMWAFEYIDLMRLQQIGQALDSDVSGFVTIQEVNSFTTARPRGWSLLRWLAYWACGWQISMTEYRRKIYALLGDMERLSTSLRARGDAAAIYMSEVKYLVLNMTAYFSEDTQPPLLLRHFHTYIDQEEERIRYGLETVKYDLADLDTLAIISGSRQGIERNLFVMLYLLLRRHRDIMRLGSSVILHPSEISDAASAIKLVKDAYDFRAGEIRGLFAQRRLDVRLEVGDFARGIFNDAFDHYNQYTAADRIVTAATTGYSEFEAAAEALPTERVLRYPPHYEDFYPENDDGVEGEGADIAEDLKPLLGPWVVLWTQEPPEREWTPEGRSNVVETRSILALTFHISPTDSTKVIAVPRLCLPWLSTRVTFTGAFTGMNDVGQHTYLITTVSNSSSPWKVEIKVALHADGITLTGEQQSSSVLLPFVTNLYSAIPYTYHCTFKKGITPEVMIFYPSSDSLLANRPAALWRYAISAVLFDVRRRLFSWSFIKERRDRKRLLASLMHAQSRRGGNPDDLPDYVRLFGSCTPADLHFIAANATFEPDRFPWLLPYCADCGRVLRSGYDCPDCSRDSWYRPPKSVRFKSWLCLKPGQCIVS